MIRVSVLRAAVVCALFGACQREAPAPVQETATKKDGVLEVKSSSPWMDFIKVEAVKAVDQGTVVSLPGRVSFDEEHTQRVASPVDGRVRALLVQPGDKVKEGQALLELSSPQIAQMQADAQKAQQDLEVAQKALDRANKLRADGAISDKELAQLEADAKKARADLARATAQLRALNLSASDPAVKVALRSQIAGTVVDRSVLVGQEVRADGAQPLLTVSDLSMVWVQADLYEQDLPLVAKGAEVTVEVPAYPGEHFAGKVTYVSDVVDPATRVLKVRCAVPNPGERLKPEMFAKVSLHAPAGAQVLMVPTKAVLTEGDKNQVVVAGSGGRFRLQSVEVGPAVDGKVRVLKGLEQGMAIVTEGALFLRHEIED